MYIRSSWSKKYVVDRRSLDDVSMEEQLKMSTRQQMEPRYRPEPEPETEPETEPAEARTLGDIAYQRKPDLPAIKRRLAQGADPNDTEEYKYDSAPLWFAGHRGHVEVVDALADAGADLGWNYPGNGRTALHAAAEEGQAGAVRSLATRGGRAALDAQTNDKWTPLHYTAANGHPTAAQLLLEAGADASLTNKNGKTAQDIGSDLAAACIRGRRDAAAVRRAAAAGARDVHAGVRGGGGCWAR